MSSTRASGSLSGALKIDFSANNHTPPQITNQQKRLPLKKQDLPRRAKLAPVPFDISYSELFITACAGLIYFY
jgi:hypothetical protein